MGVKMDDFYIESTTSKNAQNVEKSHPESSKKSFPWGYVLGIISALIAPFGWNYLINLKANSFVDEWDKCRQVDLSRTNLKYLEIRDWLTHSPLAKLPHGSKVTMQDDGRTSDNKHAVILISSYKIFQHNKIDDYGYVLSGFIDQNGQPQSYFILCK